MSPPPVTMLGGRYRIVDFVLSNFVSSGILSLYVLVQYKSQSLIEHLRTAWRPGCGTLLARAIGDEIHMAEARS